MSFRYTILLRCLTGTMSLHHNPLRWKRDFHTIVVCVEHDIADAVASLAHFQPSFPWKGERSWIEVDVNNETV